MTHTTYAVIGSNCFTGSHIVDALLSDPANRVIGISRGAEYPDYLLPYKRHSQSAFEFHQLHLVREFDRVLALLDATRPDIVINVAALSEVGLSNARPVEYFDVNTSAVVKLCNALRTRDYLRHYVHISSAEIFGSCSGAVNEQALFNPSTPYAVSKAAADMYLGTLQKNFGFPAILIRSTNVYGRHQQLFKIIPRTMIYLRQGRTIELHGGGTSVKNFIHIRDVVRGLQLAIAHGEAGTYHFSVPSDQTIAELVEMICQRMGHDFNTATRMVGERLGQDGRYWLDCSKAQTQLGWSPQVTLEQGLQETTDWIDQHWNTIQTANLEYQHQV